MKSRPSQVIPESQRSAVVVGLLGIGLIHILDLPSKWHETPYLAVAYVVLVAASLIAAAGVVAGSHRRRQHLAIVAAAGPLFGYIVSRTVGLPASTGDIGNWLEPLGLASMFVGSTVLLLIAQSSMNLGRSQSLGAARP